MPCRGHSDDKGVVHGLGDAGQPVLGVPSAIALAVRQQIGDGVAQRVAAQGVEFPWGAYVQCSRLATSTVRAR